jgi:hypothetical protein
LTDQKKNAQPVDDDCMEFSPKATPGESFNEGEQFQLAQEERDHVGPIENGFKNYIIEDVKIDSLFTVEEVTFEEIPNLQKYDTFTSMVDNSSEWTLEQLNAGTASKNNTTIPKGAPVSGPMMRKTPDLTVNTGTKKIGKANGGALGKPSQESSIENSPAPGAKMEKQVPSKGNTSQRSMTTPGLKKSGTQNGKKPAEKKAGKGKKDEDENALTNSEYDKVPKMTKAERLNRPKDAAERFERARAKLDQELYEEELAKDTVIVTADGQEVFVANKMLLEQANIAKAMKDEVQARKVALAEKLAEKRKSKPLAQSDPITAAQAKSKTPNKTPAKTPNKTPAKTLNKTPAKTLNKTPAKTLNKTPAKNPKKLEASNSS